jgi:hypothetical protein
VEAAGSSSGATVRRVSRRVVFLVVVPAVVVAVVVAAALALRSGSDGDPPAAPRADEPLAYLRGDERAIVDVDTRSPLAALAVGQVAPRLSGGAIAAGAATRALGPNAAVALTATGPRLVLLASGDATARDLAQGLRPAGSYRGASLYTGRNAALGRRGATLVLAPTLAAVRVALDQRAHTSAATARATFDRRFAGLPAGAARVAFQPRALLAALSKDVAATKWARSLRDGAAVLVPRADGLRLPFRLNGDPAGLTPDDLPIATGPGAPRARGDAPLTIALRTAARGAAFAQAAGVEPFDLLGGLPSFLRPDLGGLTNDATITSVAGLKRFTAVTDPPDPGEWHSRLERLDFAAGLLGRLGIGSLRIDSSGATYSVTENGRFVARAGVFGPTLALTNDQRADLAAAAQAAPEPPPPGAAGALTARLRTPVVSDLLGRRLGLPALVLDRLGDATAWARAELTGVTGELRLSVR